MRSYKRVTIQEAALILAYHGVKKKLSWIVNKTKRDYKTINRVIAKGIKESIKLPRKSPIHVIKRRNIVQKLVEKVKYSYVTWKVYAGQRREQVRRKLFMVPQFPTARSIANELFSKYKIETDPWTVNHDLSQMGYTSVSRLTVVSMDPDLWSKRESFSQRTLCLPMKTKFGFGDECIVTLAVDSTVVMHYRRRGQPRLPRLVTRPKGACEKVHIWVFIAKGYRKMIIHDGSINSTRYCELCLSAVKEYALRQKLHIVHDNAQCHKSYEASLWIEENGMCFLDFPEYSPDLNCVEQLFPHLKRAVAARRPTKDNLRQVIMEEFERLSQAVIDSICNSFRTKLQLCVKRQGKHFDE